MKKIQFIVAVAALLIVGGWFLVNPRVRFEADVWKNPRTKALTRQRMADDLVLSGRLMDLTRPQVVALLGEPPETEYYDEFDLVYHLGPERGFFSIDSEWLVIKLGTNSRVAEARVVTD